MAGFSDIIGHEQIIGHLKNAIALDKVSHAYIFNGPKLSGKIIISPISSMYPTKSRIPSGWTISVPRSITIL